MHARVVSNQIQPGKMDEWLAVVRDSVVPSFKEQDGFQGFVALIDGEHDKSVGYSMWTSAAELAAGETSGNYQQQIAELGDVPADAAATAGWAIKALTRAQQAQRKGKPG